MSHISEIKLSIEMKEDNSVKGALKLMEKDGYKIIVKSDNEIWIDLSDRCKHSYHSRGAQWSAIVLKKDAKTGTWTATGDPWSIQEHYYTGIKSLEKNYVLAKVNATLARMGYRGVQSKQDEKTTHKSIGKVLITARRY